MRKQAWRIFRETFEQWKRDGASRLAAALSYYSAVSIAPLLVLVLAIVGLVFGAEAAKRELIRNVASFMGPDGTEFVRLVVDNADQPAVGTIAGLASLAVLLWGSTNVFAQLQESLNIIWNVKASPKRGIFPFIRHRVLSLGMVLVIGFLLLISLILSAALAAVASSFGEGLPGPEALWATVEIFVSFGLTTLLFGLMFKFLPDVRVAWRDVWVGAAVTALLFTVGKWALGLYLGNQGDAYGIAGSVVVFLLWVFYSAQILFFGAEFTQVYATELGGGYEPGDNAERMDPVEQVEAKRQAGAARAGQPAR